MFLVAANTRQALVGQKEWITTGSSGIQVQFLFSDDWEGLSKFAVFRNAEIEESKIPIALPADGLTELPAENCAEEYVDEKVYVGVYGSDGLGHIIIPTIWVSLGVLKEGAAYEGMDPPQPTPDMWAQILDIAQNAGAENAEAAEKAEAEAKEAASTAKDAAAEVKNLSVNADTLAAGEPATVEKTVDAGTGAVKLKFGIPQGPQGEPMTYEDMTEEQKAELVQGPILDAQNAAVTAVGNARVTAVNAVGSAGTTAVNAVNQAGTTQVGNVNQAGTTQVQAVADKGAEVLDSIPQDYSDLVDNVAGLTRQLSDVEENQIPELKSAINAINDIADFYYKNGTNTTVNGSTILAQHISLLKNREYTLTWKFAHNSADTVYCYLINSNSQNVYPGTTGMQSGNSSFVVKFTPTDDLSELTATVYMMTISGLVGTDCTFEVETSTNTIKETKTVTDKILPSSLDNFKLLMPFAVGGINSAGELNDNKKRISSSEVVEYTEDISVKMIDNYRIGWVEYIAENSRVWHGWYQDIIIPKGTRFKLQCARQDDTAGTTITDPYDNDIMQKMTIIGIPNDIDLSVFIPDHAGLKCTQFMPYAMWSQGAAHVDNWLVGFTASNDEHSNTATYDAMEYKNGYVYHSRGNHNLGHCSSADYDELTDTLITANGTYVSGVTPTVYFISNAKHTVDIGADMLTTSENVMALVFNDIDGDDTGCMACFGETGDFLYVITADSNNMYLYKLVLGKGNQDMTALYPSASFGSFISGRGANEYNGTAYILKKYTSELSIELQGMKYINGHVCLSCDLRVNNTLTAYIALLKIDDDNSVFSIDKAYWIPSIAPNGTYTDTESEGVVFADGYGYVTISRRNLETDTSKTLKFRFD